MSIRPLQMITTKLFREVEWATALEAVIRGVNDKPLSSFVGSHAGYVLVVVNKTILREMIMAACRLFDEGAENRQALVAAFHLLRKADSRLALIRSEGHRLQLQKEIGAEGQIALLEKEWKACRKKNAAALSRLRSTRDSMLAHMLDSTSEKPPIYDDLFDILESARRIVGELARIVGSNTNGFGASQTVWNRRAQEYWDVLIAGAQLSKNASGNDKGPNRGQGNSVRKRINRGQ